MITVQGIAVTAITLFIASNHTVRSGCLIVLQGVNNIF